MGMALRTDPLRGQSTQIMGETHNRGSQPFSNISEENSIAFDENFTENRKPNLKFHQERFNTDLSLKRQSLANNNDKASVLAKIYMSNDR